MTHNHPKEETWHSFSWDDINIFLNYGVQRLSGVDHKYRYTMTRLPETKTEDAEMIRTLFENEYKMSVYQASFEGSFDIDNDEYDFIVRAFAKKYSFKYERSAL